MEIVIRLPIFYTLENVLNNIVMAPQRNCCSKTTENAESVNLIKNSSLASEEICFSLAETSSATSAKINLFYVFVISMGMILVTTPWKNMFRFLKWLTPLTVLLWTVNFFFDCNVILSNYSVTALRIVTFTIVVCSMYKQLPAEYQKMNGIVLQWLVPVTLLLWSFDYFFDCAAQFSSNSLIALRVSTFFILCYSVYHHDENEVEMDLRAAFVFLLFTFGPKAADVLYKKYFWLNSFMWRTLPVDLDKLNNQIFILVYGIFLLIEVSLNCFPGDFHSLMAWKFIEEIYHTDCATFAKLYIIIRLVLYCNTLILKTIQCKIFQNCTRKLDSEIILFSPVEYEIFAIDSAFLSMNEESRWNALQICFLINCGEFFSHLFKILRPILMNDQLEKKEHYKALGLSLFTIISAIVLLFFSLSKFTFSVRLLTFVILAVNVIILTFIIAFRYVIINSKLYRDSVERMHWKQLLGFLEFVARSCMYMGLAFNFYLVSTSEGFGFAHFVGAHNYVLETKCYVMQLRPVVINHFKARKFIYFISEAKPEELKMLDDVCLICHEEMTSGCVTQCKHHYHKQCLLAWLYQSTKCPLCKFSFYN